MRTKTSGLTSTVATGMLHTYGVQASRDRIARLSNLLFVAGEVKRSPTGHRRFTAEQIELLAAAFIALDGGEIELAQVEPAFRSTDETVGRAQIFWTAIEAIYDERATALLHARDVLAHRDPNQEVALTA